MFQETTCLTSDTLPGAVIDVLQGRGKFAKGNKLAPKERQVVWVTCYISSPRAHITSNSYGHLTSRSHTTTSHGVTETERFKYCYVFCQCSNTYYYLYITSLQSMKNAKLSQQWFCTAIKMSL